MGWIWTIKGSTHSYQYILQYASLDQQIYYIIYEIIILHLIQYTNIFILYRLKFKNYYSCRVHTHTHTCIHK